jgi:hypothetical protein
VRQVDSRLARIKQRTFLDREITIMFGNHRRPVLGIRKDPPKLHATLRILSTHSRDFRKMGIYVTHVTPTSCGFRISGLERI